jgi:ATP-dependent Clp protease ATP-binding subunit ClpC
MFNRFTETARRVIRDAHEEARRRHHCFVDPEHLVLAMMRQRDGMALSVLDRLGLQRDAVIEDLESALASAGAAKPATEIPFSPEAARALERSIQQAMHLESSWVGTEHLLLGLLYDGDSLAAKTLAARGVRFETALAAVPNLLGKPTGPEPRHRSPERPNDPREMASPEGDA